MEEKNKGKHSSDTCMVHYLQQGQSNCCVFCRGSNSLAGVCVLIGAACFGKAVSQPRRVTTVKSTRGLENTPCSDKLILFSMKTKERRLETIFYYMKVYFIGKIVYSF